MNDRKLLVLDLETNTVNELVSIDVDKDEVLMRSDEAGFTSNILSAVKIFYEDNRLEKLEEWLVNHELPKVGFKQCLSFDGHIVVATKISRGMNDEYSITLMPVNGDVDLGKGAGCELKINFDK